MKTYNKAVSFYKLIFTLYVVAYHSCVMVQDRSVALFRGGWLAVELFFVISGYLMVHSATKTAHDPAQIGRETFQFVVHKISRLFPYYLFSYAVSFIYMHLFQPVTYTPVQLLKEMAKSIIPFFFLNLSGLDGYEVVGATWYISAMILAMMFIYPLLLKNRNYFLWVFSPLVAVIGYGIIRHEGFQTTTWNGFYYGGMLRAFAGLCLGACTYVAAEWLGRKAVLRGGGCANAR